MKKLTLYPLLLLLFTLANAQENAPRQFIFLDDWSYELIDYWLNNGSLAADFVLNQPYTIDEVQRNLKADDNWTGLLERYYRHTYGEDGKGKIIIYGRDNFSLVSDDELPTRKGLESAPVDGVYLFDNRTKNHYNVAAQVNLHLPHLSLVNRTMTNSEFKDDPLFFGDTGEWIFGRINDAYMNVHAGPFDLFLGRMDRNWGALSSPGLILSNNPYSYDHLQTSFTSRHFKFSMIVTRLEDLLGVDSQGTAPDSLMLSRKFMTAHRFDFSISKKLQFALTEIAIYGGPDRDFEMGFLNPMNYFYVVQRNNGQQISGLWAADLFYKPKPNLNFTLQFLLDDLIVNNEPGQDDREQFPDRLGINLKLSEADLLVKGLQSGLEYTRIGNRTYQSFRTYENFQYQGKGLGFPTSSFERFSVRLNYFNLFPAILKFKAGFQRRGNVSLRDVFPGEKEPFPVPTAEKRWDLGFDVRYFVNHWSWLTANLGYENFKNYNNVAGDNRSNIKLILGVHLNLALAFNFN